MDSSETSKGSSYSRMVLPPLDTLPSIVSSTRDRSSTITSEDSTTTSTGSFNNTVTPIRPRAILASEYSFDSGFEVSPFHPHSFRFEAASFTTTGSAPPSDMAADMDDSIEGIDQELISIDHHFTPISAPNTGASTSTAFPFFSTNLANERRSNRMLRQMSEVNNNDPNFPNQNEQADGEFLFEFDSDTDDDVFYNDGDEDHKMMNGEEVAPMRESRSWHITRPSCIISESDPDFAHSEARNNRSVLFSEESVASSRRSSTPVPILRPASGKDFVDQVDGNDFKVGSLPVPVTRMPYYHPMAPPLNRRSPFSDDEDDEDESKDEAFISSQNTAANGFRRNAFGTHFETSCSIISRSLVPSRFSPVPFNGRWYPNESGAIWLPSRHLPASPTYPLRALRTDFRPLTPHYEEAEPASASSYELMFNFSQLSVNTISGEERDVELAEPSQLADLNADRQADVHQYPDPVASGHRREPLPDIVASHRAASVGLRATNNKHVHRNTLPSFQEVTEAVNLQERRTMSVSLPIEEQVISHVASQLRQISSDFSSTRQLQRFNPLSSLSPVLDLLASTLYGGPQRARQITRRQTFNGGSTSRVVDNSRFYTEPPVRAARPPPTPTTTGNSTFYVGTTTTAKAPNRK